MALQTLLSVFSPMVSDHRSKVWCCPKGTACGLPPQPLQFLLSLTSTCLLSWGLNRSLHPRANYSLIISAYQNTASQPPFILLFACQVTSPSPCCRHWVKGDSISEFHIQFLLCPVLYPLSVLSFTSRARRDKSLSKCRKHAVNKPSQQIPCTAPELILQQNKRKNHGSQACQCHLRLGRLIQV